MLLLWGRGKWRIRLMDMTLPPHPFHQPDMSDYLTNCVSTVIIQLQCVCGGFFFFVYIIDNNSSFDGSLGYKATKSPYNTLSTALFVASRVDSPP